MRDFKITRNKGEWYKAEVTDSYGIEHMNFFEHAYEANEWIMYVWAKELPPLTTEEQDELLASAIHDCKQMDRERGLRAIL
jgi:hypothetical protein